MTAPTWVFGYGSLIWKQDFPFLESRPGSIHGWARRFWQGSHDHRGTPDDPGRVVTLIKSAGERCDGVAFLIEPQVFDHLDFREKNGYERIAVDIRFQDEVVTGVMYRAAEDNHAFLGEAAIDEIAEHIHRSNGPSGTNRDYVIHLAAALRELGMSDTHVFNVEASLMSLAD